MPLYEYECQSKKCEQGKFEVLLSISEFTDVCENKKTVKCPTCNSKRVQKQVSAPSVNFTDPRGTSKMDNFGYRAAFNMEKAKSERRAAEQASHVGSNPYLDQAGGLDLGQKDIEQYDNRIV